MRLFARRVLLLALAFGFLSDTFATARAGVIISSETVTAAPGSTGYLEILLKNDSGTSQTLSGFSVDIALGGAGVLFTSVDDQTTPPYVFASLGTGTLTFDAFPNAGFIASDVSLNLDGFVTLGSGEIVGLGRIAFDIDSHAVNGLRPLTFIAGPATAFTDATGNPLADSDILFDSGGINVQGPLAAVPEPSSMVLLGIGSGYAVLGSRRRHRLTRN